jgi:hypothetical protein
MSFVQKLNKEMSPMVFHDYILTKILPQLNETGQKRVDKLRNVDSASIKLYENYGCAFIHSDASYGVSRVPQIAISMIALDPWEFSCSKRRDSNFVMTSVCEGSSYLSIGTIDFAEINDYFERFQKIFTIATNLHGHQRTPGFIYSVLQKAFDSAIESRSCPGFTDVGQHSGQVPPRDTKWNLVQMILKHYLRMTNIDPLVRWHPPVFFLLILVAIF